MSGVVAIVLVLAGLIFFHELGHFLAARSLGIGVETFSIGFGKALASWKGKKTTYQLSLIPLGGYVSLVGEATESEIPEPFTKAESFALRPPLHRLIVVTAGPLFNMVLAWFIYWGLFAGGLSFAMPEVGDVLPESPAALAQIQKGDIIRKINADNITGWEDILMQVQMSKGSPLALTLEREGKLLNLELIPTERTVVNKDDKTFTFWQIGIVSSGRMVKVGFFDAALMGLKETWDKTIMIGRIAGGLFTGKVPLSDVGGPIMVADTVHQQATHGGVLAVLKLTAMLSINLGLLNLLPIPALDGGHVFFNLTELIFRRPVPPKIQSAATYMGFVFLVGLMFMATGFDIFRLIS